MRTKVIKKWKLIDIELVAELDSGCYDIVFIGGPNVHINKKFVMRLTNYDSKRDILLKENMIKFSGWSRFGKFVRVYSFCIDDKTTVQLDFNDYRYVNQIRSLLYLKRLFQNKIDSKDIIVGITKSFNFKLLLFSIIVNIFSSVLLIILS